MAEVLNPLVAKDLPPMGQKRRLQALKEWLKFPEITDSLMDGAILELTSHANLCKKYCDEDLWSQVDRAAECDFIIKKKKAAGKLSEEKTWRDDTSETARRAWEFWRIEHGQFTHLKGLAVLVVIIQMSSCSVERVFSQLKHALWTTQDSALKDVMECRPMERINNRRRKKQIVPSFDCLLTDNLFDPSDLAFDDVAAECLEEFLPECENEDDIDFLSHLNEMDEAEQQATDLPGAVPLEDDMIMMENDCCLIHCLSMCVIDGVAIHTMLVICFFYGF